MKKLGRSTMWSPCRWVRKIALTCGRDRSKLGFSADAGPPHLAVRALAAVDDVRGVPDDDRVRVAAPRRLRVAAASGAEQHRADRGVRDAAGGADEPRASGSPRMSAGSGSFASRRQPSARRMRCTRRAHASWAFGMFRAVHSHHSGGSRCRRPTVVFPGPDEIEGFWASTRCTRRGRSPRCRSTW